MWELDCEESWAPKNWCFCTVLLEKTLERSNQSILKEISPGYSLEGLMLKLKLQYFGHLIRRVDSLEKTLILGGIGSRRRRGQQRMRWLYGITNSMGMSLSRLRGFVMDRKAWYAAIHGIAKSRTRLSDWTDWTIHQLNPLLIFSKGESWVYLFIASWLILNFINHNDNISYDKRSERTWAASSSTHSKLQYPERAKALAYWNLGDFPSPQLSPSVPASYIQVITTPTLDFCWFPVPALMFGSINTGNVFLSLEELRKRKWV